jgi:hypothetical protein
MVSRSGIARIQDVILTNGVSMVLTPEYKLAQGRCAGLSTSVIPALRNSDLFLGQSM